MSADGKTVEVAIVLPLKEVPAKVAAALKDKMPRFKATDAYEIHRKGKLAGYEFDGRRPKDKEDVTVFVSPDGKTVEIDDEYPGQHRGRVVGCGGAH